MFSCFSSPLVGGITVEHTDGSSILGSVISCPAYQVVRALVSGLCEYKFEAPTRTHDSKVAYVIRAASSVQTVCLQDLCEL